MDSTNFFPPPTPTAAEPTGLWIAAKAELAERLSPGNYKTWIEPLQPRLLASGRLALAGPNSFFINWVKNNFAADIMAALSAAGSPESGEPLFNADPALSPAPALNEPRPAPAEGPPAPALLPELAAGGRLLRFNSRFTFDSFVVGEPNLYAFSAAKALALGDSLGSDALFITADHGLGKSHLSQAVGQGFLKTKPGAWVYYLTAEDFTNEMTQAIRGGAMEAFKAKYRRNCDMLVLEEVQFLAGKEKIQAELCFTLDCLMECGKKVVFTSPEELKNIPRLGRSLRSRLSTALASPIGAPDYETRLRILQEKARGINLKASRPVLEYIAERVSSDVRQLESALISLSAKSRLLNRPVDLEMARENLACLFDETSEGLTPLGVRGLICRYFQVETAALLSKLRHTNLVEARSIGIYLSRQFTGRTLGEIGQTFGRTHSSALYAIGKLERQLKKDRKLQGKIELLTQKLLK